MSDSDFDWQDPFGDNDESARERARRRAEREARRRERQRQLGDRVRDSNQEPPPAEPGPPTHEWDAEPPSGPPTHEWDAEPPSGPPAHEQDLEPAGPPPTHEWDVEADDPPALESDAEPEPDLERPGAGRRSARRTRGGAQPPANAVQRRRLMALGLLVAALAVAVFGIATVADRIGGGGGGAAEEPLPAAEVEETITVTIPEGFDRRQIAAIAREAGLRGNYVRATRNAQGFNPGRFGAEDPDSLEGFLFPATYEVRPNAHVRALVAQQLQAFRERIGEVNMRQAESKNLNEYDVLKIASMIEREVQIPRERRLVSAVIYNRLADGSPLGIDATIRYEDDNFTEPLTESRLAEPTPYNTRVHAGLPPGPIGNPGIEAIRAAANPADVDHFYYVVKPYTCGEHVFTSDEQEFHRAVAEYQEALAEEGGAPTPEDC